MILRKLMRRCFSFGLRRLFVVFALIASVLGGFSYRYCQWKRVYDGLSNLGPTIHLEYLRRLPDHESETLAFIEDFFCTPKVTEVQFHGDWAPPHPDHLGFSSYSYVMCENVNDAGLRQVVELLSDLKKCPKISLRGTDVTDEGFSELLRLHTLEELDLMGAKISSLGLRSMEGLPLKSLDLSHTEISNSDVEVLATFRGLETLDITDSKITGEGAKRLRYLLPSCAVRQDPWKTGSSEPSYFPSSPKHPKKSSQEPD